jgi:hypothetical protein
MGAVAAMTASLAAIALASMLAVDRPIASTYESKPQAEQRWARIAVSMAHIAAHPPAEWHWRGEVGALQLVRGEVTIADHESHFGWFVHGGFKRGGGAVCLAQLDPGEVRKLHFDPESLVGFDDASTERCFYASAIVLGRMRDLAERRCSDAGHWFAPTVAAYGSGRGCVPTGAWVNGVRARAATYERTGDRRPLPARVLALLEAA